MAPVKDNGLLFWFLLKFYFKLCHINEMNNERIKFRGRIDAVLLVRPSFRRKLTPDLCYVRTARQIIEHSFAIEVLISQG